MGERYDLIVVGAGSGGIGAALAAARLGLSVLLVEQADTIGGTAVRAGVSIWERGVGGTGLPFDIYRRLQRVPDAVGVCSFGRHICWPDRERGQSPFPGSEQLVDPSRRYGDSLREYGAWSHAGNEPFIRKHWHCVVFEPTAYVAVVEEMLADSVADTETGCCTVLKSTGFAEAEFMSGEVRALRLTDGRRVEAGAFMDCTGDGLLCAACGCEIMRGQEARRQFGEPDAPAEPTHHINGVSLIYRITPTGQPAVEPLPPEVPAACWWGDDFPVASITQYPCGDWNVNMLPTMEGEEFARLGYETACAEAQRRVRAHWRYLQTVLPEFQRFQISWIAPALGVRESQRIVGEYVLTEHDLLAGLSGQRHPDLVAIADHAMDRHGAGGGCGGVKEPYGVPYRCLVPRGCRNLLVACRAASFSSLAASSCRLSRTMMQLGQAAGTAAALAKRLRVGLPDVPADLLREALREQHVQLEEPMGEELLAHLGQD